MHTEKEIYLENQLNDCKFALSKVSHEIRNPVTLINSSMQLLEKEHPEIKSSDLWQNITEDMAFLRRLLDDLSSYNNTFRCSKTATDMTPWLSRLAHAIPNLFPDKPCAYAVHIPENLPAVSIDTLKLNQALTNLLRNAFEAAEKQVSFSVRQSPEQLQIEICNDGAFIPPAQQTELFLPFTTTKANGTGLGLSIAKGILEAHGGALSFLSSETAGTTFLAVLPLC